MKPTTGTVSAADINFPPAPAAEPPAVVVGFDLDAVLHKIWRMLGTCGTANRNDQLAIAIETLIEAGVDTEGRMIGAAMPLGFDRGHAGAVLSRKGGGAWSINADGTYIVQANNQESVSEPGAQALPGRAGGAYTSTRGYSATNA